MVAELTALRDQIDEVDKALLDLLARRMALVAEVGEVKSKYGLPIYVPEREASMLASRRKEAQALGVSPDLIEDVLRRVMRESYSSENDKGFKTQQLALDTAMWDTAQAKDKMDAWLSGPNANKIEVVIANNDAMAMGAVEALKAHNKSSIPVFGVDALPEALALVKSGAMAGTVLNDANNQAKATFDLAKNLADGKEPAAGTNWKIENKIVRVPYVGVDKDNLSEFIGK